MQKLVAIRVPVVDAPILLSLTSGHAQTSAGGSIRGGIADSTGSVIPPATVIARSPNLWGAFHGVSDSEGNYRLLDQLPDNDYTSHRRAGFSKFERKGVIVRAGLNIAFDIDLTVGNMNRTVEVMATDSLQPDSSFSGATPRRTRGVQ